MVPAPLPVTAAAADLVAMVLDSGARLMFVDSAGAERFSDLSTALLPRVSLDGTTEPALDQWLKPGSLQPLDGETRPEDVLAVDGDVRREVMDALRRSGYIQEQGIGDDDLFDALSAYIRTENFEEREQERGYLDWAVLEYMKGQS